ncbi:MAG TPA: hypothetical protein VGV90_05145, partial [Solirubrobacteraceae bacterium]|nr:hypothetical protein [Solirubrobacteraceae bacterium]
MSTDDRTTAATAATTPPPKPAAPARTIAALVLEAAARYRGTAMRSPEAGDWTRTSYPQLGGDV